MFSGSLTQIVRGSEKKKNLEKAKLLGRSKVGLGFCALSCANEVHLSTINGTSDLN